MAKRGVYRRRHRKDGTQDAIVEYLRAAGCSVAIIGEPVDLAVAWGGVTDLVEVKTGTGRLNADQEAFYKGWQGRHVVLRSVIDAQIYVSGLKGRSAFLGASTSQEQAPPARQGEAARG